MTATIQRYLLQYYAEIEREKNVIDLNCREIQLAITRLENKFVCLSFFVIVCLFVCFAVCFFACIYKFFYTARKFTHPRNS